MKSDDAFIWGMIAGAIIGVVISLIIVLTSIDESPTCQEDEVAIHGGLETWYDRHDNLECVNIEEFLEVLK